MTESPIKPDMRSWAKKECDECGNVEEFSRSVPRDFNKPFTCSDCELSTRNFGAGYAAGLKKARKDPRPLTKAKLWRKMTRLCGEAMMFGGPSSPCWPSPENESTLEFARRVSSMSVSEAFTPKFRELFGKIAKALAAWEAAE